MEKKKRMQKKMITHDQLVWKKWVYIVVSVRPCSWLDGHPDENLLWAVHYLFRASLMVFIHFQGQGRVQSCNAGFLWSLRIFESLGKIICHFHGLESLGEMNDSSEVFERLWILTSPVKIKANNSLTLRITSLIALHFGRCKLLLL